MSCWRTKFGLRVLFIGLLCLIPILTVSVQRVVQAEDLTESQTDIQAESWVPGLTPGWDGNGLAPFADYVTQGEESVALNGLKLVINSPVLSLPGRGMDLKLGRVYGPVDQYNPYKITGYWYWDLPHYYKGAVSLPGGATYYMQHCTYYNYYTYSIKTDFDEGVVFSALETNWDATAGEWKNVDITLSDGTVIHDEVTQHKVVSPNGATMTYEISCLYRDRYRSYYNINRITKLTESAERVFRFEYDPGTYELTKVIQETGNGDKTIITRTTNNSTHEDTFTDALGRKTTYTFSPDWPVITDIKYPNGARSHYEYTTDKRVSKQMFYRPGETTAYRTVNYSMSLPDRYTTVDDGTCIKRYYFTYSGHTYKEETYTRDWKLLKRVTNDFLSRAIDLTWVATYNYPIRFETARPWQTTTELSDGTTMAKPIIYNYGYDNWGNTTYIKYPTVNGYAAETHLRYHNTKFEDGTYTVNTYLQQYGLQNCYYKYTNYGWYNRLATKGTIIYDSVHNTRQLSQTHYDYDSEGNLLTERVVYNNSFLLTDYRYQSYNNNNTYDSYSNLLYTLDSNGDPNNILYYEYDPYYRNAYKTRIYKPNGTTLARYAYDFDLGKPSLVTDPKGNSYWYKYDAIGRVVEETLDIPDQLKADFHEVPPRFEVIPGDPDVKVSQILAYDDAKSMVTVFWGNSRKGWQVGRIEYDPLFGKPKLLKRLPVLLQSTYAEASLLMTQLEPLISQMVTQKEYNYDSNGRLSWEKDGMGHTTYHYYDELDRERQTKWPNGSVTNYTWNYYNRDDYYCALTITDDKKNTKKQYYDLLDRQVKLEEHPNAATTYTTQYTYDSAGHLVQTVNPRNAVTKNTYNQLGQPVQTDYPETMTPETYTYDNVGNLKTKTGAKGTKILDYEFYTGYRVKRVTEPGGRRTVDYTYDANDNILIQSANGASYIYSNYDARNRAHDFCAKLDGKNFNFSYNYDTFGRITGITYPNRTNPVTYTYDGLDRLDAILGFVNSCTYDGDNKMTGMFYANGINNTWSYDPVNDRLTNIGFGSLMNLSYGYDSVGNITRINNDYYDYDGMNRLTWAGDSATSRTGNGMAWTYDAAGNMASKESYLSGASQGNVAFGYDLANRLLLMGSKTYKNDNAGNRAAKIDTGAWSYIYDGENRLTQVTGNGIDVLDNTYDGAGMRTKEVKGGQITYFIYQGNDPLVEYTPSDAKYKYFIYAGNKRVAEETDGVVKYYHSDHLGSTRVTTDVNGNVLQASHYEPYGNPSKTVTDFEYSDSPTNKGWAVYDGSGAVNTLYDNRKNSQVLNLNTNNVGTSFAVAYSWGLPVWNDANINADSISLDLNASNTDNYILYVNVVDTNGKHWFLTYCYGTGAPYLANEYCIVPIDVPIDGNWHTICRNLKTDLQNVAGVSLDHIAFICIRGNLSLDNINVYSSIKYGFTGKEGVQETGLIYFGARWYDPETGRFLTQDPAKQGSNWYSYCHNNPLGYVDPDGKMAEAAATLGAPVNLIPGFGQAAYAAIVTTAVIVDVCVIGVVAYKAWQASRVNSEIGNYSAGDRTPGGRTLTDHAAKRANERGFTDRIIDNIINNNKKTREKEIDENGKVTWKYTDKRGNTVITNEDGTKIVTEYGKGEDGEYAPPPGEGGN